MKQLITICLLGIALVAEAQSSFDKFKQQQDSRFDKFKSDKQAEYDAFRQRANAAYADFMRQAWETFPVHQADKPEEEKPVPPVVYKEPDEEPVEEPVEEGVNIEEPEPTPAPQPKVDPLKTPQPKVKITPAPQPKQIPVQPKVVVVPKPAPAPEPIAPVKPKEEIPFKRVSLAYYGTIITIGFPTADDLKIKALKENALADAWKVLSGTKYDITIKSALDARQANDLCDWAYMDVIKKATEKQYGRTNEAVLMQAYLMTQSGYRIRLGMTADKLFMLIASKYDIYNLRYISIGGTMFYITGDYKGEGLHICQAKFEKEQSLSLQLARLPRFGDDPTPKRTLSSNKGVTAAVSVNKNLIDFFNQYPQASIGGDFTTRWAAYANTPLDQSIQDALYPKFKKAIASMSERDAVGLILNWVQTAFQYGYDDQIWGGDRAFFPQETLYYPHSDCEDRAILFSRLVRDIMELDVVLLYYPGHLATAVAFTGNENGDWLTYNNRRYIVCDPTYINASVGMTMPGMDNQKAKVIVLKK